ncbi:hypothetical protein PoB_005957000 [Plakobranchus ocellatus]|uniref:Uncharacterized protein n=1 Tax=Plakobranchus ocellatus TaxID=259542 RepID=A0AAV4CLY8_9GAST|nr:hypothetical protein PoB_005957000 [Plakobranchus ocellatus]
MKVLDRPVATEPARTGYIFRDKSEITTSLPQPSASTGQDERIRDCVIQKITRGFSVGEEIDCCFMVQKLFFEIMHATVVIASAHIWLLVSALVYSSATPRATALAGQLNYVSDPLSQNFPTRNVSPHLYTSPSADKADKLRSTAWKTRGEKASY